ncbi:unnamed protein product [Arabis nemorensis]|uniref:Uncharacterized protein n=1 Tax=Arabis nemorensis TaxID=586526 RepID=A0A565BP53_9BRAS|nr:unnamed protein product [Arabis nemorensis]
MKTVAVNEIRRSKRQACLDVSPVVSLNQKKNKKDVPAENEIAKNVEEEDIGESVEIEKDQVDDESVKEQSPRVQDETIPPPTRSVSNASESLGFYLHYV